ncbi:hypothetical protein ABH917_001245 [Thermobifida halotolerans]
MCECSVLRWARVLSGETGEGRGIPPRPSGAGHHRLAAAGRGTPGAESGRALRADQRRRNTGHPRGQHLVVRGRLGGCGWVGPCPDSAPGRLDRTSAARGGPLLEGSVERLGLAGGAAESHPPRTRLSNLDETSSQARGSKDPRTNADPVRSVPALRFRTPLTPRGTPRHSAAPRSAAPMPQHRKHPPRRMTGTPHSTGASALIPAAPPPPLPRSLSRPLLSLLRAAHVPATSTRPNQYVHEERGHVMQRVGGRPT